MHRVVLVLLGGAFLFACASSKPSGNNCDPASESCSCDDATPCPAGFVCDDVSSTCVTDVDAPTVDPTDAPTDAPLKGFGEPCLDKGECASNICIFVGTGGRCT